MTKQLALRADLLNTDLISTAFRKAKIHKQRFQQSQDLHFKPEKDFGDGGDWCSDHNAVEHYELVKFIF